MVTKAYLLDKPAPPQAWQRFVDLTAMPLAIDAAGAMEGRLEALAVRARRSPLIALGLAFGLGCMIAAATGALRRT
jgi:hypothetical protein